MLDCRLAARRKKRAVPPNLPSSSPAAGMRTSSVRARRMRPRLPPDPRRLSVHLSHARGQIHRWIITYR